MRFCALESALECHYYDRALTRIAELIKDLRITSVSFHREAHHPGMWTNCKEEPCKTNRERIRGNL